MIDVIDFQKNTRILSCLECGKCTASCPVSLYNGDFSPRRLSSYFVSGNYDGLIKDPHIWTCLACGLCSLRCPSGIRYPQFIQQARAEALKNGNEGILTHGGVLQSIMRMMTEPKLNQNRLDWVTKDLKIALKGDILYFVGCLPYFDVNFEELGIKPTSIAYSTVKILNYIGITPVVMKDERCCGHDLLWTGDIENFKKLMKLNLEAIAQTGAKTVIFSCAEGYRTFKVDYAELNKGLPFKVMHLTEFLLSQPFLSGKLKKLSEVVSYQDPCRLGRHLEIYDPPRTLMKMIPGLQLKELAKSGKNAICCGTNAWINCDQYSKKIQLSRLQGADQVGAEWLITACPKCYIHFSCAKHDTALGKNIKAGVKDISVLLAEALL